MFNPKVFSCSLINLLIKNNNNNNNSALAETAYLGRHNQLAKLVHQQLGIKQGPLDTKDTPPYYKYCPAPVLENSNNPVLGQACSNR